MNHALPGTNGDLFDALAAPERVEEIGCGAFILRGFIRGREAALLSEVERVVAVSPLRQMSTPGGYRMSVAMTNCGELGWVTDQSGYRYDPIDPLTEQPWPRMPQTLRELAAAAAARAGFSAFKPDACLINRYATGARLSLHRDYDERDAAAPIVSVSIGVPAKFLWGGLRRADRTRRFVLESGDVAVWGGESRFVYHGIAALGASLHPLTGSQRINLTFRKAG